MALELFPWRKTLATNSFQEYLLKFEKLGANLASTLKAQSRLGLNHFRLGPTLKLAVKLLDRDALGSNPAFFRENFGF